MPDDLIVDDQHRIPAEELELSASRSSGPGGQHVNTTDSRIQVRWDLRRTGALTPEERERVAQRLASRLTQDGILVLACDVHRSQRRNREEILARLAALLRQALHRPRPRKRTAVPKVAREQRLQQKRARAELKRSRRGGDDD
jgi:ribosome-associated protein